MNAAQQNQSCVPGRSRQQAAQQRSAGPMTCDVGQLAIAASNLRASLSSARSDAAREDWAAAADAHRLAIRDERNYSELLGELLLSEMSR